MSSAPASPIVKEGVVPPITNAPSVYVKPDSASNSVVVAPTVTNSFAVALFNAVIGLEIEVCSVPAKSKTSQCNVPSKYPSLNSNEFVPRSISLSVTGEIAPSLIVI